jgi:hypothetical protein
MGLFSKPAPTCSHQWETVGIHFNPPRGEFKGRNISETTLLELMYGITTVSQQCANCGYMQVSRHAGKINYDGYTGN